jgi:hypothetical protein
MTKQTFTQKSNGDTLSASEWNNLTSYINTAVDAINAGGGGATIDSSGVLSVSSKGNVTVGSNKNINLEPAWDNNAANYVGNYGDVAIKSGDDIQFCSHHREPKKRDKVVVKALDGSDNPVKFELGCGEVAISTKGKAATLKKNKTTGADVPNDYMFKPSETSVMDVKILTGNTLDEGTADERDERGYLKVRAQAIDLRCEKHGGVALQPKGYDGDGNMNKIKFEHGGGDGLEFGTFNTEKTSIFTDEYRFNKDGVWKMATRQTTPNSKAIYDDNTPIGKTSTAALQYVKQADDFYDIIAQNDEQCTTKDIIKTAYAMNGKLGVHTKITNKGTLEIGTSDQYTYIGVSVEGTISYNETINVASIPTFVLNKSYSESEINTAFNSASLITNLQALEDGQYAEATAHSDSTGDDVIFVFQKHSAPSIKIDSGAELKLGGILDFGSSFNFGETDNGIEVQYKLTKKNAEKDCGIVKVVGVNNHATNDLTVEGVTIAPGQTATIAQCSMLDIIKLVNYMKTNNEGPWAGTNL